MFSHRATRSSQELVQKCPCIPGFNWNLKMLVLRRGENQSTRRKTSRSRVENQQTQPICDAGCGTHWWRARKKKKKQARSDPVAGDRQQLLASEPNSITVFSLSLPVFEWHPSTQIGFIKNIPKNIPVP